MNRHEIKMRHLNYLCHHGVEGQKWGVRHGPPYPLDDSQSTGKRLKTTKMPKQKNKNLVTKIMGINNSVTTFTQSYSVNHPNKKVKSVIESAKKKMGKSFEITKVLAADLFESTGTVDNIKSRYYYVYGRKGNDNFKIALYRYDKKEKVPTFMEYVTDDYVRKNMNMLSAMTQGFNRQI